MIDATINLGHLLTSAGFFAAALSGWYSLRAHVEVLNTKLQVLADRTNDMSVELRTQTEILVRLERQEVEIGVLRTQLNGIQIEAQRQRR